MTMAKMFIKTVALSLENNPITWNETTYTSVIDGNTVVGYLLLTRPNDGMAINLYLLPANSFYEGSVASVQLTLAELKTAFLQWLEVLAVDSRSFQFRNPAT